MVDLKGDDGRIKPRVNRMQNSAAHWHAVMAFQHGGCIGKDHRDIIALAHPVLCQARRQLPRARIEIAVTAAQGAMNDGHMIRISARSALKKTQRAEGLMIGRAPRKAWVIVINLAHLSCHCG